MDRLQAAIAKARAQRQGKDELAERDAPRQAPGTAKRPRGTGVEAAWHALKPLEINRDIFTRNRLISFDGGKEAAPYDMLRTKILQQARANGWRRIAITSPNSSCGKSTSAANLAFSFGRQQDVHTMVLDFDLRRMGLAKLLAQEDKSSMGDVLERRVPFRDHARRLGENVAFGLNGSLTRNPSEILQSAQAAEVLAEIEETYKPDLILFDTPPLMASDDSHGFLKIMDCALLLAAAEQTPIDQIDVAERQLAELTSVMGIVLNKCHYMSGAYGYEYGYYD